MLQRDDSSQRLKKPTGSSCLFHTTFNRIGCNIVLGRRSPVTSAETSQRPVSRHRSPRTALCKSLAFLLSCGLSILMAGTRSELRQGPRSSEPQEAFLYPWRIVDCSQCCRSAVSGLCRVPPTAESFARQRLEPYGRGDIPCL